MNTSESIRKARYQESITEARRVTNCLDRRNCQIEPNKATLFKIPSTSFIDSNSTCLRSSRRISPLLGLQILRIAGLLFWTTRRIEDAQPTLRPRQRPPSRHLGPNRLVTKLVWRLVPDHHLLQGVPFGLFLASISKHAP